MVFLARNFGSTRITSDHKHKAQYGFALVIVLFSLTVLTLLFAVASTRTIARIDFSTAERGALQLLDTRTAILDSIVAIKSSLPADGSTLVLSEDTSVRIQPTVGLIDLNTASPELLERFLQGYGLPLSVRISALDRYSLWRRSGQRLMRVSDFMRVAALDPTLLSDIDRIATVHSGREGISGEQAPLAVLRHLSDQDTGTREELLALLPRSVLNPAPIANFAVFEADTGARIGVVHLGGTGQSNRILAINGL